MFFLRKLKDAIYDVWNATLRALGVELKSQIAGEDFVYDVLKTQQRANYTNITSSQIIKTGAGRFYGFIVASHTSGTLKLWDNTSNAAPVLINTFTFAAGSTFLVLPFGVNFSTGLYATVGGTGVDMTIFWQ